MSRELVLGLTKAATRARLEHGRYGRFAILLVRLSVSEELLVRGRVGRDGMALNGLQQTLERHALLEQITLRLPREICKEGVSGEARQRGVTRDGHNRGVEPLKVGIAASNAVDMPTVRGRGAFQCREKELGDGLVTGLARLQLMAVQLVLHHRALDKEEVAPGARLRILHHAADGRVVRALEALVRHRSALAGEWGTTATRASRQSKLSSATSTSHPLGTLYVGVGRRPAAPVCDIRPVPSTMPPSDATDASGRLPSAWALPCTHAHQPGRR